MNNTQRSPQRQREYALYRYRNALESGDFETVSAILKDAERDPVLNQMIAEMDMALESDFEAEIRYAEWQMIGPTASSNGQPPKLDLNQEKPTMTAQTAYWEPGHSAVSRPHRWAVAMGLLVAVLVIGILFLFLIPSGSSIQTLVLQQPTQTPAEIAKLYVEELWGKGNTALAKTLLAADFVDHDPMLVNNSLLESAGDKNNSAVFNYNANTLLGTFPDLAVKTEAVVVGDDRIVVRWTFTGTNTQSLFNFRSTGKSVTVTNTDILRIVDGKISERWGENKLQPLLDAIGVVTVDQPAVEAVTAFARFAYIYGTDKIDELGEVYADQVTFNGETMSLKDLKAAVAKLYDGAGGYSNIKMNSATIIGNHVTAEVEFYTNNGVAFNHGTVTLTIKDGKIESYSYYDKTGT